MIFTPSVASNGNLSWTNDGGLENPTTVNIMGAKGDKGDKGDNGKSPYQAASEAGYTGTEQTFNSALTTFPYHNARHLPDGADPITVKTGNIEDSAVTTAKLKDGAVTRAKLANDALYSPFKGFDSSGVLTISINDIGKTIRTISGTADYAINVSRDTSIPAGAEIAIFRQQAKTLNIVFASNTRVAIPGETAYKTAPTLTIGAFEMIALKKLASDSNNDYWLVTGNVEVVK